MRLQNTGETRRLQIALNSLSRLLAADRGDSDEARDKARYIVSELVKRYFPKESVTEDDN